MDFLAQRWITAPLEVEFAPEEENKSAFRLEFERFSESDDDPLSSWLKIVKARGDAKDSDPVLLALITDLHRKVDELTMLITHAHKPREMLRHKTLIEGINYTHFKLGEPLLITQTRYYGRIKMPVFPIRDIGFYFTAQSQTIGELVLMHEKDQKSWDSYVASRERVMIRQSKAEKNIGETGE